METLLPKTWGMAWVDYLRLANEADCVINAAANVKHYGIYHDFEATNVKGTERLISFAMTGKMKDYHHVSTLSVASGKIPGIDSVLFTEYDYDLGQTSNSYYVQSKLEAEKLVLKARENGLNANIFRLGSLVFNSVSGIFQQNIADNGFYSLVKSLLKLGVIPQSEVGMFDFSYVNVTSSAIIKLFNLKQLSNETYHIFNSKQVSLDQLGGFLIRLGYKLAVKTVDEFLDCLCNYDNQELRPYIESILVHAHMLEDGERTAFQVVSDKTDLLLGRLGFQWDDLNEEYMRKMMQHCEAVNFI
jgi:thioester reductase-like protein